MVIKVELSLGAAGMEAEEPSALCSSEAGGWFGAEAERGRAADSCERQCSAPNSRMTTRNIKAKEESEKETEKNKPPTLQQSLEQGKIGERKSLVRMVSGWHPPIVFPKDESSGHLAGSLQEAGFARGFNSRSRLPNSQKTRV